MDNSQKGKLVRWIRQQVLLDDDEKGRCKKIVLRHVAGGRYGSEILTAQVPKKAVDDSWFEELANDIEIRVTDDAEGLGGMQTYCVHSLYERRPDKPGSRFTIRETSADENLEDAESEPPTKTGIISQMMRHSEAATRIALMATGQIMSTLKSTNARQADMIEKLVSEKMANLETMEKLRSEEMERRIILQRAEADEKRKSEIFEKLTMLLPVAVNRISGKNLLPEKASGTELVVKGLIESITPEQLEKLQGVLRPEQLMTLLDIFQSMQPAENPSNGSANKENKS